MIVTIKNHRQSKNIVRKNLFFSLLPRGAAAFLQFYDKKTAEKQIYLFFNLLPRGAAAFL